MQIRIFTIISLVLLAGCANTTNNKNVGIEGVWFSDCVETSLLPFPSVTDIWERKVIMELTFDSGVFTGTEHLYEDANCQILTSKTDRYTGTYVVNNITQADSLGNIIEFVEPVTDNQLLFSYLTTAYFTIENNVLYFNDLLTNNIAVKRDVAFNRE